VVRLAWVVLAAGCIFGCSSQLSLRAPDYDVHKRHVVFMPAMVALSWLDTDDSVTFDDKLSRRTRISLNGWLRFAAPRLNGRLADLKEVSGTALPSDLFYERMNNLAGQIIADQGKRPLSEWSVGDGFDTWAATLRADDVVFISFRALYPTKDRQTSDLVRAINPYGHGLIGWLADPRQVFPFRTAVIVDVDLHTRRVVRFETRQFSERLEGQEIPAALANLTEALELGRPLDIYESATEPFASSE
jgi:hypothetical protein